MGSSGMVIVGAGEAGVRAAFALREQGYQGTVTLIGDETHLPYERPLADSFGAKVKLLAEEGGYKLYEARR